MRKNGERSARTIHTGAFKGEASVSPLQETLSTKRNTGYTIRSTCHWPFSHPTASTLGKRNPFKQQLFQHQDNQQDWTTQFPHIRDIL
ncbi:hypothetical protein PO124_08305 [Bacillus licheniformis]|nr:hypothetical protein [Bacillus licheniformis]